MKTLERERRTKRRHRWFPWAYEVWPYSGVMLSMTGAVVFTLVIFVAVIGTIVLAVNLLYEPQYYTCYGGRTLVFIDGQALCFESAIPATEVPSP